MKEEEVRPALLAICLLVVSFALFFPRAMIPGNVIAPVGLLFDYLPYAAAAPPGPIETNPVLTDQVTQFYPWHTYSGRQLEAGRVPLWNPYNRAGEPFLANSQSGVLFPLNLLLHLVPDAYFFTGSSLLKIVLAGLFMYLFLVRVPLSVFGALFGALVYAYSSFQVAFLNHPHTASAIWLPLVLLLADRSMTKGAWWSGIGLALTTFAVISGGHIETAFHVGVLAAMYTVLTAAQRERGRPTSMVGSCLRPSGYALAGAALAGVVLLPFVEYLLQSQALRERVGRVPHGLRWIFGITQLVPDFLGHPLLGNYWWPHRVYSETNMSLGVPALGLAVMALGCRYRRLAKRRVLVLAGFCVVAVFSVPLLSDWIRTLPLFRIAANTRLMFGYQFCVAALAGLGASALGEGRGLPPRWLPVGFGIGSLGAMAAALVVSRPRLDAAGVTGFVGWETGKGALLVGAVALLLFLCLTARRWAPILLLVLLVLQFAETWYFKHGYNPVIEAGRCFPETDALGEVRSAVGRGRVLGLWYWAPPNTLLQYGIPDLRGYDALWYHRNARLVHASALPTRWVKALRMPHWSYMKPALLDLFGVTQILSPRRLFEVQVTREEGALEARLPDEFDVPLRSALLDLQGRCEAQPPGWFTVISANDRRRYPIPSPPPDIDGAKGGVASVIVNWDGDSGLPARGLRAVWGSDCRVVAIRLPEGRLQGPERFAEGWRYRNPSALPPVRLFGKVRSFEDERALLAYMLGPRFLPDQELLVTESVADVQPLPEGATAELVEQRPGFARAATRSRASHLLWFSMMHFPGWRATLDGDSAPVRTVDFAFPAVEVPAGSHVVELSYEPYAYRLGLFVSCIAAMVLGLLVSRPAGLGWGTRR